VEGTVARGSLREDAHLYTGKVGGQLATTFPFPITRHHLERGQERYEIFCAPCHGRLGDGRGMVVQRGFPAPRSYHEAEIRKQPPGYFFDVITQGFGRMQDYAAQVRPEDRWAIVAYIQALQLSQGAPAALLTAEDRQALAGAPQETP
jgi:cytochrome c553